MATDARSDRGSHSPRGRAGVCGLSMAGRIFRGWALAERYAESGVGQRQWRRAWPRCSRAWLPGTPWDQGVSAYGLALLAKLLARWGARGGSRCWPGTGCDTRQKSAAGGRAIGSGASYCWRTLWNITQRRKPFPPALDVPVPAGKIAGAAGRHEPEPLAAQGKQVEARALLAPIYGWFTEGLIPPTWKRQGVAYPALMNWASIGMDQQG
jgi:hypothetical protein